MSWLAELSPDEWSAIRLSLKVSLTAALATLPVALALAFALARGRFAGKALLDGLILLPLVLPPVVTGYVLLIAFGRRGPIGAFLDEAFGIVLAFRWTGAALACAIMGLPLMVRTMRLAIEGVDRRLEAAAGVRQVLAERARETPGLRVLEDRFQRIDQAIGVPRGRAVGAAYIKTFLDEMRAAGVIGR